MKTSRRLLLGTFLALLAMPVVLVAYSRFSVDPATRERPLPERTSPAELAALRDFTAIEISGDLDVEISSASDYSIEYAPISERRGNLEARVEDGTLFIEAFGNRIEAGTSSLRIGLPALERLEAEYLATLTVRNFDSDMLELRLAVATDVLIENNRIASLQAELGRVSNVEFRTVSVDVEHQSPNDALFFEQTLDGYRVLRENHSGLESSVDLSLLFGFVTGEKARAQALFSTGGAA